MFLIILSLGLCSCVPQESSPTTSSLYVATGDILVGSNTTDTVHQFDSNGNYIRPLWRTTLASETIGGIGWKSDTNEILITMDGTPDRVVAISVTNGAERVLINNTNIAGTLRGATQLRDSEDILVSELTSIERTSSLGTRETFTGVWPSTVTTNIQNIVATSSGGFVTASSTTGLRAFADSTSAFAATATVAGPAGATASYGIAELPSGEFIASWEGAAADYLSIYSSGLVFDSHIINNNQSILQAPRGVAVKRNGKFLVADNTLDYVLEVTPAGSVVKTIGVGGLLEGAYSVFVVPEYSP